MPVVVPREFRRPILVYAAPLHANRDVLTGREKVLVIVRDLNAKAESVAAQLRVVFRLSAAEAKLVDELMHHHHLKVSADALKISFETARSQMKSIFAKCEISRQSQLIQLVSRLLRTSSERRES
jgi:DNA-binding CsgD family transcriptional regulator